MQIFIKKNWSTKLNGVLIFVLFLFLLDVFNSSTILYFLWIWTIEIRNTAMIFDWFFYEYLKIIIFTIGRRFLIKLILLVTYTVTLTIYTLLVIACFGLILDLWVFLLKRFLLHVISQGFDISVTPHYIFFSHVF